MRLSASTTLFATLLIPFLTMLYVFLITSVLRKTIIFFSAFAILFCAVNLGVDLYAAGEPFRYSVGGWGAPLGIDLYVDGLSAMMLILTATTGVCVTVYSKDYYSRNHGSDSSNMSTAYFFWPLWFFTWGALNALFLSADIFNIYVSLEVMTFSAIAMITLASSESALFAAGRYLFATLLGSLAYLLGVGLLYSAFGVLDIAQLGKLIEPQAIVFAAASLMIIGLLIKSALFPMHFWLPAAHANAPSPVGAVLSGLVITAPIYLVIRFCFELFSKLSFSYISQLLGVLGVIALFWGSIQALRQERLKMLIAYSTVAQIGYVFLLFPLANGHAEGEIFAWNGGILFAVSHGCAKAAAFMAAGAILSTFGHDRIQDLRGLAQSSPMSVFVLALAGINLMGMPPSGGFVAKWMLLKAAILSGQWWYVIVMIMGGFITACYIFKVLEICLFAQDEERKALPNNLMHYASLTLALVSIFLGLGATLPLRLLEIGQPVTFRQSEGLSS